MQLGKPACDRRCLAQLLEGASAVAVCQRGVDLLENDALQAGEEGAHAQLLSSVLCTLAETKVEVVAEDDDASALTTVQTGAEQMLQRSHTICANNPEPLQVVAHVSSHQEEIQQALALLQQHGVVGLYNTQEEGAEKFSASWSVGVLDADAGTTAIEARKDERPEKQGGGSSQERREEALTLLKQSTALWWGKQGKEEGTKDAMQEGEADGQPAEEGPAGLLASLSPYAFCIETAKLLLDLDATTSSAEEVLQGLLVEDESCLEVWYLLALAQYAGGARDVTKETLQTLDDLLAKPGAIGPTDDRPDLLDLKVKAASRAQDHLECN
ncbi:hypothetical protein WJX74_010270 [Apatococcus lobatus]|uniref:Uncharacterized protein n=1 Tax=Apatococcus lobatus TaxID=904363 RepID=A0AAW1S0K3_9CHLO